MINNSDIIKLHIVTVATHDEGYFKYLQQSCKKHGSKLKVLGFGEKWQGYNWRIKLMIDYLKTIKSNDIVCFVDGYDVICTRNLLELKEEFINFTNLNPQYNIIISMYTPSNIIEKYFVNLQFGLINNECLVAGLYIGYVKNLYEMLNNIYLINSDPGADDQQLMVKYYKSSPKNIYLDTQSYFFCNRFKPLHEIDKNIIINKNKNDNYNVIYNKQKPFFLHSLGSGYLDNVIIKLDYNYNYNDKIKYKVRKQYFKKVLYHSKTFLKSYILFIFIIILLICIFVSYCKNNNKIKYKVIK
jgi:hypothetical protein